MSGYVPLWCKSNFSFLEGASHPEELVEACASLGVEALALTDRDGVYGLVEAHVKARELGLQLIPGAEVHIEDRSTLILLATDRDGYANLCRLLTAGRLRSDKGESRVRWDEVCAHAGIEAYVVGDEATVAARDLAPAIEQLARARPLHVVASAEEAPSEGAVTAVLPVGRVVLPMAGLFDLEGERGRLTKQIGEAQDEVRRLEGKLANEQFRTKAPAAVVAKEEERLATAGSRLRGLEGSLAEIS